MQGACIGGCYRGISEGDRSGYVVKLSHKGMWWKSWEGSMHLAGGNAGGGGSGSDTWDFSVRDDGMAATIQEHGRKGDRVTLHYIQWWSNPWTIDTVYEVTGIFDGAVPPDGGR